MKMGRDEDLAGRKEGVLKGTETTSDGTGWEEALGIWFVRNVGWIL